jgi:tetratricopeptide (TPR) repeat protein
MAGESEYSFWHVLTRDVAYSQLPRASRATKHVTAAEWLEAVAGDRAEDLSDVLAHHYATALDLARAAGSAEQAAELEEPARRFLTLAGRRSINLDYAAAASFFERALALTPIGHPERGNALLEFGEAAEVCQRFEEARKAIEEAVALFEERGDPVGLAQATLSLGTNLQWSGDTTRRTELTERAVALLEAVPPGEDLVVALCESAANKYFEGRPDLALPFAERAVRLADELGVDSQYRSLALCRRGLCLASAGDRRGIDDLREASAIGMAAGTGHGSLAQINLEAVVGRFDGPVAALEENRIGIAYAKARGITHHIDWMAAGRIDWLTDLGDLDQALEDLEELEKRRPDDNVNGLLQTRVLRVRIATLRGRADAVEGLAASIEEAARGLAYVQWVIDGLGATAGVHAALGRLDEARMLVAEIEAYPDARNDGSYVAWLPGLVRVAQAVGDRDLAARLVADLEPKSPLGEHALVTARAAIAEQFDETEAAANLYAEAASRWALFGNVPEEAFALLGQGRCLATLGKPQAVTPLREASKLFSSLGAEPALAETEALLAEQQPAAS